MPSKLDRLYLQLELQTDELSRLLDLEFRVGLKLDCVRDARIELDRTLEQIRMAKDSDDSDSSFGEDAR